MVVYNRAGISNQGRFGGESVGVGVFSICNNFPDNINCRYQTALQENSANE